MLREFSSIDQLLHPYGSCVILIVTNKKCTGSSCDTSGHWCALLRTVGGIEFFDPYGVYPDYEFHEIGDYIRDRYGQQGNQVNRLLYTSRDPVMYNQIPLQQRSSAVNTCGRWCAMRIRFANVPVEEFATLFDDITITDTTEKLLGREPFIQIKPRDDYVPLSSVCF